MQRDDVKHNKYEISHLKRLAIGELSSSRIIEVITIPAIR